MTDLIDEIKIFQGLVVSSFVFSSILAQIHRDVSLILATYRLIPSINIF